MRQLLWQGGKLKDTIKHLLTQGPRLKTGVVNQHETTLRLPSCGRWLFVCVVRVSVCCVRTCVCLGLCIALWCFSKWSQRGLMIRIWCSDRDNEVYITSRPTNTRYTVLTRNSVACCPTSHKLLLSHACVCVWVHACHWISGLLCCNGC